MKKLLAIVLLTPFLMGASYYGWDETDKEIWIIANSKQTVLNHGVPESRIKKVKEVYPNFDDNTDTEVWRQCGDTEPVLVESC